MRWIIANVACLSLLTAACGGGGEVDVPAAVSTVQMVVATPEPTGTPTPTSAPANAPEPTPSPEPTFTAEPTPSPEPTATPTPLPEPIIYSGSDSDVIDVEKTDPRGPALVYIRGNAAAVRFAVDALDKNGERLRRLVNTHEPYEGVVLLDIREDHSTARLEIRAEGDWHVEVRPIGSARDVSQGDEINGHSDDVFIVRRSLEIAQIVGNDESNTFIVTAYGDRMTRLVNTQAPFEGRVIVPPGTELISVEAETYWTITFE